MERRKITDRRAPDTERKMVLPNRRMDGIARRVADAILHAARMKMLYPNFTQIPNAKRRRENAR